MSRRRDRPRFPTAARTRAGTGGPRAFERRRGLRVRRSARPWRAVAAQRHRCERRATRTPHAAPAAPREALALFLRDLLSSVADGRPPRVKARPIEGEIHESELPQACAGNGAGLSAVLRARTAGDAQSRFVRAEIGQLLGFVPEDV